MYNCALCFPFQQCIYSLVIVKAKEQDIVRGTMECRKRKVWEWCFRWHALWRWITRRPGSDYLYSWCGWTNVWIPFWTAFGHTLWGRREKPVSHMCDIVLTRSVGPSAWTWETLNAFKLYYVAVALLSFLNLEPQELFSLTSGIFTCFLITAVWHNITSTGIIGRNECLNGNIHVKAHSSETDKIRKVWEMSHRQKHGRWKWVVRW